MKRFLLTFLVLFYSLLARCGNVCISDPFASINGKIKINIILKAQSDVTELSRMADAFSTKADRRDFVVNSLKDHALLA